VGCGSIGRRHIRILRALGETEILAFDVSAEARDRMAREFGVTLCETLEDGLDRAPGGVLVCTPPTTHLEIAGMAVRAKCHVFIEKPLSHALDGVDELLETARTAHRIVYVGYNLRFHPGLLQLKRLLDAGAVDRPMLARIEYGYYLPYWRDIPDYRSNYMVRASMGGGIILDSSHELDYLRWLFGEVASVYCEAGKLSDLEMETEDSATMILRMRSGVVAQVHVDCVQQQYTRTCKVIGTKGTIVWDHLEGVRHFTSENAAPTSNVEKVSHLYPIRPGFDPMYVEELRHFITCVRGADQPQVTGEDGRRVLEVALAARRSARERREVLL